MEAAAGIVLGLLMIATGLVAAVLRFGIVNERLGRWLDKRIYARFPRLGHMYVSEQEDEE